jgi:hypothetical protein
MTKDIAGFLERIPAIDRCSAVVKGGERLLDIYNARVSSPWQTLTTPLTRLVGTGQCLQGPAAVLSPNCNTV